MVAINEKYPFSFRKIPYMEIGATWLHTHGFELVGERSHYPTI